jgi:hypothetical protein
VIQDHTNLLRLGTMDVDHLGRALGKLLLGPLRGHAAMPPPLKRLHYHAVVTGAVLGLFRVNATRVPRRHGPGLTAISQPLIGTIIEAPVRPLGHIGRFIEIEPVFHPRDALGTGLGDAPRLL